MEFSIAVFLVKMSLSVLGMCCFNRGYITWPRECSKIAALAREIFSTPEEKFSYLPATM